MSFQCVIVTPDRQLLDDAVESAILPAHDGQVGILDHRAPLLASLGAGPLVVRRGGAEETYYIEGGVAQMKDNKLTVVTDDAMPAADLDRQAAQTQLDEANAMVATDEATQARKEERLRRARAKLAMVG